MMTESLTSNGRILLPAAACHPQEKHSCTSEAAALLCSLRESAISSLESPAAARRLSDAQIPACPPCIPAYAELCIREGLVAAAAVTFDDVIVDIPTGLQLYMSGEKDRALQFEDASASDFLKQLFQEISRHARGEICLTPTDLYHAHMFLTVDAAEDPSQVLVDFGLLFHAKEFPREWRHSRFGAWQPVGSPEAGGIHGDPRVGTQSSVSDESYPLRNLIWLMSTNSLYQLDPKAADFKIPICSGEFSTVSTDVFDSYPPGDINYFPEGSGVTDGPEKIGQIDVSDMILCCPRYAFGVTLSIKNVASMCKFSEAECPALLEEMVGRLDDREAMLLQNLVRAHSDMPEAKRMKLGESALRSRIEPHVQPLVSAALVKRRERKAEELTAHNAKERKKMLDAGVQLQEVELALERTASKGRFSEMRASNLLHLTSIQYRTEDEIGSFGSEVYGLEEAAEVLNKAVWLSNTFVALQLMRVEGISEDDAVKRAISQAQEETTRHLNEQIARVDSESTS